MLSYIYKIHLSGSRTLLWRSLLQYSTTSPNAAPQHKCLLEDYLINSLGFSKPEAIFVSNKAPRLKPINPNLVVNFFENLGFSKTHVKSIVSSCPKVLWSNVDKTLKPKIKFLQDLGISGPALVKLLLGYKRLIYRGLDSHIKPRIEYLRQVLGTDEKVVVALKRYALLLGNIEYEKVDNNVLLLQKFGFSKEKVAAFIANSPMRIFVTSPEWFEKRLHLVENYLGIPRESTMFHYGLKILCGLRKSTIDKKFDILRSYGWSNEDILRMVRCLPLFLGLSETRMRKSLDYFMNELGYTPDYLALRPFLFTLSLEKRIKPRNEVLKILNEKNLNTRKRDLGKAMCLTELKFVQDYLLPYKNELPDVFESYIKKLEQKYGPL